MAMSVVECAAVHGLELMYVKTVLLEPDQMNASSGHKRVVWTF
jgi:hypothetical protein